MWWSWFLNKCLLIFQYLLIQYKGIHFNYDGKYSIKYKTNHKTLFNILKQNKNTKFLLYQRQKVNFNKDENIKSAEDFKKLFPKYTTYSDYRSYVMEIMNDGHATNIMSVGYPIASANTSGTSGDSKHFPVEGTIPADELLSSPLPINVRLALESTKYHLSPNPSRAQELRKIVGENGFHHVNTCFWLNLKCGVCIISPSIRQFELKLLSTYWNPDIPIFPYVYGMSEHHRISVPLKPNSYNLIPLPRSVYYEFIALTDDDDENQPSESFELHQLEQDKYYEVVLTTYDGLYRYRTDDIIKVTGHYYSLPAWQLIGSF
ncbi:unnamed protein product, partial [Rotaria sp. Silwood2]